MNYKITFFSENGFEGKVPRNHPNMRTEYAWMSSLNADHYNIYNIPKNLNYDIGIIIYPKNVKQQINYNNLYNSSKKIGIMQEGPNWYWESLEINDQIEYYNSLSTVDFILCHNEIDKKYFKGLLLDSKPVYILPSLIIENLVKNINTKKENKTIIGGNLTDWYGGFPSYVVASNFGNLIYVPQMGRMKKEELNINEINHLPYMNWIEWMKTLSIFKFAVHMMPTIAAGTFTLNCAYFGIPCIGYFELDTQRLCHTNTSVNKSDIKSASEIAIKLKNDENFYNECSKNCKINFDKFYSEKVFLEKMTKVFDEILKKF